MVKGLTVIGGLGLAAGGVRLGVREEDGYRDLTVAECAELLAMNAVHDHPNATALDIVQKALNAGAPGIGAPIRQAIARAIALRIEVLPALIEDALRSFPQFADADPITPERIRDLAKRIDLLVGDQNLVYVPLEPTEEMLEAGMNVALTAPMSRMSREVWAAMVKTGAGTQ